MLNSSTQRILNKFSQPLELILFLALTISAQNFFSISDSKSLSSESSQPYDSSKISEYEKQARMQGYSDEQIDLIKSRYGNTSKTTNKSVIETTAPDYSFRLNDSNVTKPDSIKDTYTDTIYSDQKDHLISVPYFGYSIFNQIPEAFKPNTVGPVDPGYIVGPGDVLRLAVWGQVEFQYELTVNKEGKIFVPVAGQVHVTGIPFIELQNKIKMLLSRHYSGLASDPPRTFLDLTVAQLRPLRIFIMGEVESPGGYTVSSYATTFNALYSVGGPLTQGTLRNIKVLRNGEEITTVDLYQYLLTGKCTTDVRLQNNDVIFVPKRGKTVTTTGSVFRPGIYELKDDENLKSLLDYCGSIPASTNIDRALIHRILPFDQRQLTKSVINIVDLDLKKHLESGEDYLLFDGDSLDIIPLTNDLHNYVRLDGAVYYPGVYQSDNLSLSELIFNYGKPIEKTAYMKRADLIRLNDDLVTTTLFPVDLDRLKEDKSHDVKLQAGDEIIVYEKNVEKPTDLLVTIEGEVKNPDTFTLDTNMTVMDLLIRAGGFTRNAYRKSVDVFRLIENRETHDTLIKVFKINLPDSLDFTDQKQRLFQLKDRDRIIVRPDPNIVTNNYVIIDGLVKYRGKYAIEKRGERLSDLIKRAGGLMPDAFPEGAKILRNNKRVVVNFSRALQNTESKENVLIQKGDSVFVPVRPNAVYVHGNVNNPGLFSYDKNSRARDYVDRAGGLADSSHFILIKSPNGETEKIRKRGFSNPRVDDGTEIYVIKEKPKEKTEKQGPTIAEVIRDSLAIMTSAVSIVVLLVKLN